LSPAPAHAPYDFGWPDELVGIHFPRGRDDAGKKKPDPNASDPWFYFLIRQTPTYFQYIGSQLGGKGWQCDRFLPVIRILPIDTQVMTPTTEVGFGSLEEAIDRTNAGEPISQDAWGRFRFTNRFFWDVLGRQYPTWASFSNGLPKSPPNSPHRPIGPYIKAAATDWYDRWSRDRNVFNNFCNTVTGGGSYGMIGAGSFALPFPPAGTPLPVISAHPEQYYFGAIPPFAIFQQGQALIWKQSFSFQYAIAQLDSHEWNMNRFPPRRTDRIDGPFGANNIKLPGGSPSHHTGKFGGYGGINFPLTVPLIAGTS